MPVQPQWIAPFLFACCLMLWKPTQDRVRLRTAVVFLALWLAIWISTLFPIHGLLGPNVVEDVATALVELAAVLIAAVIVFDLVLHKIRLPRWSPKSLSPPGTSRSFSIFSISWAST